MSQQNVEQVIGRLATNQDLRRNFALQPEATLSEFIGELVGLEIDKSWDELHASWVAVQVADAAVEQAEVNLKEESDRYENGLVTLSDLLEAQVLHRQVLEQRIDTRSDFWLRRSAYLRAAGIE